MAEDAGHDRFSRYFAAFVVILVQAAIGIIWGAAIETRMDTIETRGSPGLEMLRERVRVNELRLGDALKAGERIDNLSIQVAAILSRLSSLETRLQRTSKVAQSIDDKLDRLLQKDNGNKFQMPQK